MAEFVISGDYAKKVDWETRTWELYKELVVNNINLAQNEALDIALARVRKYQSYLMGDKENEKKKKKKKKSYLKPSIQDMERDFKTRVSERLIQLYQENKDAGLFGVIDMRESFNGEIYEAPSCVCRVSEMWEIVVEEYLSDPNKTSFDGEFFYNEEDGKSAYTMDAGFFYNGTELTIY